VRRTVAGWLIRVAHKIYPPKVTVQNFNINVAEAGKRAGRDLARHFAQMQHPSRFN